MGVYNVTTDFGFLGFGDDMIHLQLQYRTGGVSVWELTLFCCNMKSNTSLYASVTLVLFVPCSSFPPLHRPG